MPSATLPGDAPRRRAAYAATPSAAVTQPMPSTIAARRPPRATAS